MDISVLEIAELELNCKSSCTPETVFDVLGVFYTLLARCELILCVTVPNPIETLSFASLPLAVQNRTIMKGSFTE